MALNPIVYTEKVVKSFLRYQLTAYPFADPRLHAQMRALLSLDETRRSPLLKGPYLSLSRSFRRGAKVRELVDEGLLHPLLADRVPPERSRLFGHQETAIRAIVAGRTTLVSTGTGSGKTECFLYPIISRCLQLRDEGAPPGISAVIVYPMNALAEDQLMRLRSLLAGTGIPFGMYVGKTPEREADVAGMRLPPGSSRADYEAKLTAVRAERRGETVYPSEEVCSRERMRTPGRQPRILLTNVNQLELLLTRQRDVELFADARLDFLVFDEAHTFTGARGAETACLIRRLRAFCGRDAQDTACVATSATIVDRNDPDAARSFASRFFGVPAASVMTVSEDYEEEVWEESSFRPGSPAEDPAELLERAIRAVEREDDDSEVPEVYRSLAGQELDRGPWPEALHDALTRNEIIYRLACELAEPRALSELPPALEESLGRPVTEAEILAWLTLGAAAVCEGRPLLRPVVHAFVRGIGRAVVTFPAEEEGPRLWLTAEDELEAGGGDESHAHFPVLTCTTCGQHYFETYLKDFEFAGAGPGGGEAVDGGRYWEPLEKTQGGQRVVLLDHLIGGSDDADLEKNARTATLYFCRYCGAAHDTEATGCRHCGRSGERTPLFAILQKRDNPGVLPSCLSCGANGRRIGSLYREPARPVRATNVADVHVLAQDMVHHSERRRLLVFCDNRQDAAFQAGWMKDHARRFRLRALMAKGLDDGARTIGDVTAYVDDLLEKDEALSRALVPEVWQVVRREGGEGRHEKERRKFLRIQVLREVALSSRQPIGLEPWGRMRVDYEGLDPGTRWIQEHANQLGFPPQDLCEGVASLLDYLRRKRILHDPEREIFTRYWMDGDQEIQQGYLPQIGSPTGTKLRREGNEKPELVTQWLSERGDTTIRQIARKWGVTTEDAPEFLEGLFAFLTETKLLVPVRLKGAKGRPLSGVTGLYQVDADRLRLQPNHGVWRCRSCRRRTPRRTPSDRCPAWRCDGTIEFVREDPDNYDLQLLDQGYSMLRPEEHTAMVPHDERERLENLFKSDSEAVNCFVCTPTLELGVDIGRLDAVLMRNVPPLPANYWQRAGRAGRRHRMAVDFTYCRPVSHDRAYFAEPTKLLAGRVDPPAFNLRNEVMVAKHVHATVITRLHQFVRDPSRSDHDAIDETLRTCLPERVAGYLFEGGNVREQPFDFRPLRTLIEENADDLVAYVERAFRQGWPETDSEVTSTQALRKHVLAMPDNLEEVVGRLRRRLNWAREQIRRLNEIRDRQGGALENEDEMLFRRCERLVKRLKGTARRRRTEAEGYDDVNTYSVLAAEGFLPGYGLEVGSVLGIAEIPFWRTGAMEFTLPRPPNMALREYVPGNLIYANGNRFVARRFHRDIDEERAEIPVFEVAAERRAIKPTNASARPSTLAGAIVPAISVCDVDLVHRSHISDEENFRFQLGVAVYGRERGQHAGGQAYAWGPQALQLRRGVRLQLVNVGATSAIERFGRYGYPVCTVCGQSASPLSSNPQREHFEKDHLDRCHCKISPVGFYANVVADVLTLPDCPDQTTAYSVLETLRIAASRVLDMDVEDLQILVVGHVDRDEVDGHLWDPMPGGSGLLDQLCERFGEIVDIAEEVVARCPSACEHSCIDCLQTFRNSFYHRFLDRNLAEDHLRTCGKRITASHPIPPLQPAATPSEESKPVNEAEQHLRHLLLEAGFSEGIRGEQIRLDRTLGTTTPDVIYRAEHHDPDEGVCIYLDGLSEHLHGNPQTAERDREIRSWLRAHGYEVIEIAASDLDDEEAMVRHFRKLAGYLGATELRNTVRQNRDWFRRAGHRKIGRPRLKIVQPGTEERYRSCVPLVPLEAAAGAFGDPQNPGEEADWDWVEIGASRRLRKGMFVSRVVGESMEPRIPDGSYCLFSSPVTGSRQGRIVLVQLPDATDPETGQRFTVKRYRSKKETSPDGTWRHVRVALEPLNPEFQPIKLRCEDEHDVTVVAEFLEVLAKDLDGDPGP